MWRYAVMLCAVVGLSGCQSTHQELLAKGYPPAFADGFDDGCSSGRQATRDQHQQSQHTCATPHLRLPCRWTAYG